MYDSAFVHIANDVILIVF